jgi:hypothetical protein
MDPNKGLPEGLQFVGFGAAGVDDYELTRFPADAQPPPGSFPWDSGYALVTKGPRALASSGFRVDAAEGYILKCDIRNMTYFPVKKLPAPVTITATVVFTVDNGFDQDSVQAVLARLKQTPGFQSIKEQ